MPHMMPERLGGACTDISRFARVRLIENSLGSAMASFDDDLRSGRAAGNGNGKI